MKKVELKKVNVAGMQEPLDYASHIIQMLQRPKTVNPMGMSSTTAAEMRTVNPILDKIEEAVSKKQIFVLLEDAEFNELCERAESHPFTVNHKSLQAMVDDIVSSPAYMVPVPDEVEG